MAEPLKIFGCTEEAYPPGVYPSVRCYGNQPGKEQGQRAASILEKQPEGGRALYWQLPLGVEEYNNAGANAFWGGIMDVRQAVERATDLCKACPIMPDVVIVDIENLPLAVASPADNKPDAEVWGDKACEMVALYQRRVLLETFQRVYGKTPIIFNFDDLPPGVVDINGWLKGSASINGVYSPEAYNQSGYQSSHERKLNRYWNAHLDAENRVRACCDGKAQVWPWIEFPRIVDREYYAPDPTYRAFLWQQKVARISQLRISGFVYWHQDNAPAAQHETVARTVRDARALCVKPASRLSPIEMDTAFVTTGEWATMYLEAA